MKKIILSLNQQDEPITYEGQFFSKKYIKSKFNMIILLESYCCI